MTPEAMEQVEKCKRSLAFWAGVERQATERLAYWRSQGVNSQARAAVVDVRICRIAQMEARNA